MFMILSYNSIECQYLKFKKIENHLIFAFGIRLRAIFTNSSDSSSVNGAILQKSGLRQFSFANREKFHSASDGKMEEISSNVFFFYD